MIIEPLNNSLRLTLTAHDWKYHKPGCFRFIEALKLAIPASDRQFDPESKAWTVDEKYAATIEELRQTHLVDQQQQSPF